MIKQVQINNYTTLTYQNNFIRPTYNITLTVGLLFGVNVFGFTANYNIN